MMKPYFYILTTLFVLVNMGLAEELKGSYSPWNKTTTNSQVHLLELFSSEGCSSCPPAEGWLTELRKHTGLWTSFVPVAFHVDYWNQLGWHDRFSKQVFTARQNQYAKDWGTGTIYTPAFVLDGRSWRVGQLPNPADLGGQTGNLSVQRTGKRSFHVNFVPLDNKIQPNISGALLGNGLVTRVMSGENSGKTLRHEFVVLSLKTSSMKQFNNTWSSEIELSGPATHQPTGYSVSFWITDQRSNRPIQALGGDLDLGE